MYHFHRLPLSLYIEIKVILFPIHIYAKMFKISLKPLTSELSLCIDLMMRPAYLCQELLTEMKNTST